MSETPTPYEASIASTSKLSKPQSKVNVEVTTHEPQINKKVCLIVEAIALGSLGMPSVFSTLGMVPATILTIFMGFVATGASLIIGEVMYRYPQYKSYADIGGSMFGAGTYIYLAVTFVLFLTLAVGSHVLTAVIAFKTIAGEKEVVCSLVFSVVAMVLLYLLALPTNFHDMSILGFIDCASILTAIFITIIASGIEAHDAPGGISGVQWKAFKTGDEAPTFAETFLAITTIVFSLAFAQVLPTMSSQLARPQDYKKALWTLGSVETVLYTIIGATIYAFKGDDVKSPSLLSTSPTVQKVAFGVALPVIFISGSINTTTAAIYVHKKIFNDASPHRLDAAGRSRKSLLTWLAIVGTITIVGWVLAESIPSFGGILGLMAALFVSCFSYWFPALMWFKLLKNDEPWHARSNIVKSLASAGVFVIGIIILVAGLYATAIDLRNTYRAGTGAAWSC